VEIQTNGVKRIDSLRLGIKLPGAFANDADRDESRSSMAPKPFEIWFVFKNKAYRGVDFRLKVVVPLLPSNSL